LFIGPAMLGIPGMHGALTIDCSCQFLGPVALEPPIDLVVDLLRETGRMAFIRGIVEQEGESVAAFSGTVRKARD
jgi:acyl-coenzyme A thioesterase PaaI-like protein